jgi:hypothetical protein
MKYVKTAIVLLVVAGGTVLFWRGGGSSLPALAPEQQEAIDAIVAAYRTGGTDAVKEFQVASAASAGQRATPHLLQAVGSTRLRTGDDRTGSCDVFVAVLARIAAMYRVGDAARTEAVDGICAILRHDHSRAHIHHDRKVGAAALVLLGEAGRAPVLAEAVAQQEGLAAGAAVTEAAGTLAYLRAALDALGTGRGRGEPDGLCWFTDADGRRVRGFRVPLGPAPEGPQAP